MNLPYSRRRWASVLILTWALTSFGGQATQRDAIRAQVDLVVVPASVRDQDGRFVYDLQPQDFRILEDGRPQQIAQFSIDPSPLSVAVLVDSGVGGTALDRIANSLASLRSAFTEADEVELYRFDHTVLKLCDFTSCEAEFEKAFATLGRIAARKGNSSSSPLLIAPGRGPRWLRWLLDRGAEARVLNDAMFEAAVDLEGRPKERRRVIVVISDGQVAGSEHSLDEVRTKLVRSEIQTYGVSLGLALLGATTSAIQPYAEATGGDVYGGRTQNDLESGLARISEQARHQYVLSYVSNNEVQGPLPVTRTIKVTTERIGLDVRHRKSYLQFPLPR